MSLRRLVALVPSALWARQRLLLVVPVAVVAVFLAAHLLYEPVSNFGLPRVFAGDKSCSGEYEQGRPSRPALDALDDVIRALWAPLRVPVTAPTFTTLDGHQKHLPPAGELVHTEPLGKRVCILDVDNRGFEEEGGIFSSSADGLPSWDKLGHPAAGFLSHYLYATIHGYAYKFVRSPKYKDRAPHWSKVLFTKELLKRYDVVVMLDYDAMFPSPELPLEWLLNYWRIGPEVLVAMPEDPSSDPNWDARHRVNINSGFIIAQASGNLTQRLFRDWAECPDETRYRGCAAWKDRIFHEQSAFSSHVRYDFLDGFSIDSHPQYIRMLPCEEANGIPATAAAGCFGRLVRHYWGDKQATNAELAHGVMSALVPLIVQKAYRGDDGHVEDYRHRTLEGSEVL